MPSPPFPQHPHASAGTPVRRPGPVAAPPAAHPAIRARRSRFGTTLDLVARIGTAVTLVALMVVIGSAFAALDDTPVPTGAATTGR